MRNKKKQNKVNGAELRAWREKRGLSQQDLEYMTEDLGQKVTKRTIGRIENGADAHLSTIRILAKALEVDIEGLLVDEKGGKQVAEIRAHSLEGHTCSFVAFIEERTRDFVGRRFVFDAIDEFIKNNDRGYFFIRGDPGIGKSSIAAQLVKERGYIHHFNIRAEGINKAGTFLRNVCSQLIIDYELEYNVLPPDICADNRFLTELLEEVSKKSGPDERTVIVVDALDEVDTSSVQAGSNALYLPRRLPQGIFIMATTRRYPLNLRIECNQANLDIEPKSSQNLDDIEECLECKSTSEGIRSYLKKRKLSRKSFVDQMKRKSEGNFMYLRYVLPEIESGAYKDLDFDRLPVGLENYYEDHWHRMGMTASPLPKERIKVIYVLSEVRRPVSRALLSDFCKEDEITVQSILDVWIQFLHKQRVDKENRYSLYHNSFRDFLNRQDIVQAAGFTVEGINKLIGDNLWGDLMGNE
jgi:transcriptional regulator with XRE-family HTH domain